MVEITELGKLNSDSCKTLCFGIGQIELLHASYWLLLQSAWHFHDHSSLLLLISPFFHPAHIQETWLPAGRGSAQRRLQPVRKNPHQAPHASLSPSFTLLSSMSPMLLPWHPSLLSSSASLLLLPFDSDHWVSLRLFFLGLHFAWQMDRAKGDGLKSRGFCVCLWDGRRERKEKKRKEKEERGRNFWEVKCQTAMKCADFHLSNVCEVLAFRQLSDKDAVKRELRYESEGDRMSLPLIHLACHTVSASSVCALFYLSQSVKIKGCFFWSFWIILKVKNDNSEKVWGSESFASK